MESRTLLPFPGSLRGVHDSGVKGELAKTAKNIRKRGYSAALLASLPTVFERRPHWSRRPIRSASTTVAHVPLPSAYGVRSINVLLAMRLSTLLRISYHDTIQRMGEGLREASGQVDSKLTAMAPYRISTKPVSSYLNDFCALSLIAQNNHNGRLLPRSALSPRTDENHAKKTAKICRIYSPTNRRGNLVQ